MGEHGHRNSNPLRASTHSALVLAGLSAFDAGALLAGALLAGAFFDAGLDAFEAGAAFLDAGAAFFEAVLARGLAAAFGFAAVFALVSDAA